MLCQFVRIDKADEAKLFSSRINNINNNRLIVIILHVIIIMKGIGYGQWNQPLCVAAYCGRASKKWFKNSVYRKMVTVWKTLSHCERRARVRKLIHAARGGATVLKVVDKTKVCERSEPKKNLYPHFFTSGGYTRHRMFVAYEKLCIYNLYILIAHLILIARQKFVQFVQLGSTINGERGARTSNGGL